MQCSRDKISSLPIMPTDQNKELPEPLGQHDIQDSTLKVHSVLETSSFNHRDPAPKDTGILLQPQRPCPKRHRYTTSTTETLPQKTQVYYFNHRDPAPKDTGILLQPQRPCPKRHRYTTTTLLISPHGEAGNLSHCQDWNHPQWTDFGHGCVCKTCFTHDLIDFGLFSTS